MLLNLTLVGYKEFCRSWGVLSNSAFYGGPCKHKEHVKKNQLLHTANKKEPTCNCQKSAHYKQRITRCKQDRNCKKKKNCTLLAKELHAANKSKSTVRAG